jgi:hypothetical protein
MALAFLFRAMVGDPACCAPRRPKATLWGVEMKLHDVLLGTNAHCSIHALSLPISAILMLALLVSSPSMGQDQTDPLSLSTHSNNTPNSTKKHLPHNQNKHDHPQLWIQSELPHPKPSHISAPRSVMNAFQANGVNFPRPIQESLVF